MLNRRHILINKKLGRTESQTRNPAGGGGEAAGRLWAQASHRAKGRGGAGGWMSKAKTLNIYVLLIKCVFHREISHILLCPKSPLK